MSLRLCSHRLISNDFEHLKRPSCLYRAATVSRHFFITPNWCTQL